MKYIRLLYRKIWIAAIAVLLSALWLSGCASKPSMEEFYGDWTHNYTDGYECVAQVRVRIREVYRDFEERTDYSMTLTQWVYPYDSHLHMKDSPDYYVRLEPTGAHEMTVISSREDPFSSRQRQVFPTDFGMIFAAGAVLRFEDGVIRVSSPETDSDYILGQGYDPEGAHTELWDGEVTYGSRYRQETVQGIGRGEVVPDEVLEEWESEGEIISERDTRTCNAETRVCRFTAEKRVFTVWIGTEDHVLYKATSEAAVEHASSSESSGTDRSYEESIAPETDAPGPDTSDTGGIAFVGGSSGGSGSGGGGSIGSTPHDVSPGSGSSGGSSEGGDPSDSDDIGRVYSGGSFADPRDYSNFDDFYDDYADDFDSFEEAEEYYYWYGGD